MKLICKACGKVFYRRSPTNACSRNCSATLREGRFGSLCMTCGRGYARPFDSGGCEKILNGKQVYDEYVDRKAPNGVTIRRVTKCQLWIPERK